MIHASKNNVPNRLTRRAMRLAGITLVMAGLLAPAGAIDRYVSPFGTNNAAGGYTNWADAATNIQDAITVAAAPDIIYVTNAVYVLTGQVAIAKGVSLVSAGGMATLNGNRVTRCLQVTHTNGIVDGFVISNGLVSGYGAGAFLGGGHLRNCLITDNIQTGAYKGAGVFLYYGTLTNCVVSNNICVISGGGGVGLENSTELNRRLVGCTIVNNYCTNPLYGYGGGIYVEGTNVVVMTNCTVRGNVAGSFGGGIYCYSTASLFVDDGVIENNLATNITYSGYGSGGGLCFPGAGTNRIVRNSIIRGNVASSFGTGGGGGIQINDGLIDNCQIISNVLQNGGYGGGGVYSGYIGSTNIIRNCLIAYNTSISRGGGIHSKQGCTLIQNCTIVSNYAVSQGGGINHLVDQAGKDYVDNTLIYFNSSATANSNRYESIYTTSIYTYCVTAPTNGLIGYTNVTAANPLLADRDSGDFRLTRDSPCVNAGINQGWMNSAFDLDDRPRLDRLSGQVDIGAYEWLSSGIRISIH